MTDTAPAKESAAPAPPPAGPFAPFSHKAFALLWTATLLSNIGTWMHDVAAAWLMTSLSPSPLVVSLVQAATTAAMALFALPAGAMADLFDRRRLLMTLNLVRFALAMALAALTALGLVEAWSLLAITFLLGVCSALMAPVWQSIVPSLVPRPVLKQAVAMNSMGINIARAIGPTIGGILIVAAGAGAAFAVNGLSELIILAALLVWTPPPTVRPARPERFASAMVAGLRYAGHAASFRLVLWRAAAFFLFASAYWALLPVVARVSLGGDATLYGMLVGAIGAGAVAGALVMPAIDRRLGANRMVMLGSAGTILVLLIFALLPLRPAAILASAIAGMSWIFVLSTLNVAAQNALPDWVRGRGLSIFGLVFFGAMTAGSIGWGALAQYAGIPVALVAAAAGMTFGILATRSLVLGEAARDLTPSGHWPEPPAVAAELGDRGPVMVLVEYRIAPDNRVAFLDAAAAFAGERRRDGAHSWEIFEDAAEPGRFVESFVEESWAAHLRHHARVTRSDADLQAAVAAFHLGPEPPRVTHLLAARD